MPCHRDSSNLGPSVFSGGMAPVVPRTVTLLSPGNDSSHQWLVLKTEPLGWIARRRAYKHNVELPYAVATAVSSAPMVPPGVGRFDSSVSARHGRVTWSVDERDADDLHNLPCIYALITKIRLLCAEMRIRRGYFTANWRTEKPNAGLSSGNVRNRLVLHRCSVKF
jgi:hypothetical protein